MEYRGYDSSGIAVNNGEISVVKKAGKLANLEAILGDMPGTTAIGHTRWATHGRPTDENAHPHVSFDGRAAIVHNGIIENFASLRAEFDVEFASETDSEVAAHLLNREVAGGATLVEAMRAVAPRLEGAFTLVAIDALEPGRIVAARRNSPLVLGQGEGEYFLASDVAAFI